MLRPSPNLLSSFLLDAEELSEEEFFAKHDTPFLVIPGIEREAFVASLQSLAAELEGDSLSDIPDQEHLIVCLALRPKYGPSMDRITLGRDPSADVVILDDTVSKFHAEVSWDPAHEKCRLTDNGSRNGTKVSNVRVTSGGSVNLSSGVTVALGNVQGRFFAPGAFLAWIKNRVGAGLDTSWLVDLSNDDSNLSASRTM